MERPEETARAGVEAADVLPHAPPPLRARIPRPVHRPRQNDGVSDDDRPGTPAVPSPGRKLQVHPPAVPEGRDRFPGPGIERVHGGAAHRDDPSGGVAVTGVATGVSVPIARAGAPPVGDASEAPAARVLLRLRPLDPARLPRGRIEGLDETDGIGRVQRPVDEDGRPAQVAPVIEVRVLGRQLRADGRTPPQDLYGLHVLAADLREGGVPVEGVLPAVVRPLIARRRQPVGSTVRARRDCESRGHPHERQPQLPCLHGPLRYPRAPTLRDPRPLPRYAFFKIVPELALREGSREHEARRPRSLFLKATDATMRGWGGTR